VKAAVCTTTQPLQIFVYVGRETAFAEVVK